MVGVMAHSLKLTSFSCVAQVGAPVCLASTWLMEKLTTPEVVVFPVTVSRVRSVATGANPPQLPEVT
ncbi:hypothetical protein D7X74_19660 [Corallococcus sp. CA047B]|nr:hypothetical protein D7X74_19660 [Corallococcus sp. CA047B]